MTAKEQADFAANMGYHPAGKVEIEVDTPITEKEKLALADEQSRRLMKAEEIDGDKKAYAKKKIGEMNSEFGQAMVIAKIVSDGFRREVRQLPCFFDAKRGQRIYVDPETMRTVKTEPMTDADRQLKLV